MKKIIALILALIALLSFASCAKKAYESTEKTFSANGMTIKLTSAFEPISMVGYASVYESRDAVVYVSNQSMTDFEDVSEMSVAKYAEFFCKSNSSKNPNGVQTDGELIFTEYSGVSDNVTYKYLTAFFEGDGVYLRVEFVSEEKNYEEYRPYFINWAKTVTVEAE